MNRVDVSDARPELNRPDPNDLAESAPCRASR